MVKEKRKIKYNIKKELINKKHSYLLEYYNKALDASSDIIVGSELMDCLKSLIVDLDNPEYYYDNSEAELRINFIETFLKHTKSPFFGVPFVLELWEKAVIEVFYSFQCVGIDDGSLKRRFRKLILLIARKNGKSTLAAALGFTEFIIGNSGSDIVCASNDDAQANLIFDEISNMRERFDPKEKRTHKNLRGIFNLKNKSTIKKLSERTRNKEGRNIDFAILDESHELKDNVIAKSIEQSQSSKREPVFINITTEGFVDGFLDSELRYARQVLAGEIEDNSLLVWLYTMDSEREIFQNEMSWKKANPSLGAVKSWDYLRREVAKSNFSKADRVFMLAKDFNIKQNKAQAWLMESDIVYDLTYNIDDFINSIGLGAVDLSETTDLTSSKVLIMRAGCKTKYFFSHYFIPESKVERGSQQDKKDYLEWAKGGFLTICKGNEVNYSDVVAWFVMLYKKYKIRVFKVGYDKWNSKSFAAEMDMYGFELERIVQDYKDLSNPMKILEADLKSKLVNYNNNPIDRWCLSNCGCKVNEYGQIKPVKIQDYLRIDGAVTMIIAYSVYDKYKLEYLNLVERSRRK